MMKHVSVLLAVLIGLCSVGCGSKAPSLALAPPPVILRLADCPAPAPPHLPLFNEALPFDAQANIKVQLERDDILRAYIKGLCTTIDCFRLQQKGVEK